MKDWRRWFRSAIISSARVPWIRSSYRKACEVVTWEVGRSLASVPGVEAIYTRHSHPRSATFAPGQSDLDLTIVLSDSSAQDPATLRACSDQIDALHRRFFFVFPQDVRLISRRELAQIEDRPGSAEILGAPNAWIKIGGREVRCARQLPAIDRHRVPLHPEFNAWWLNVMQTHVLTPQTSLAENEMRLCFRIAMKSKLHLLVASGRLAPPAQTYLPDAEAASLFAEDPEMTALIRDLARNGFRASDGARRKAGILHRSLAQAAEFYRELPRPPQDASTASAAGKSAWLPEAHRSELRERFGAEEALRSLAEGIIIYPTPHWFPREYQIDLILRDDVTAASFGEAVRIIRDTFGGHTFGILGTNAQLTMVPRRAFEHPLFFLGTPFPFLHEHVAAFAETLIGTSPRIPAPPSHAERLRWCAQYYLFHRFTLHYRPGYVSKDGNFCQLAAVRLFLETGAIYTDSEEVRRAYLDAFVKQDEDREALNLLLRANGANFDQGSFATALKLQSRDYDAVEALLGRHGQAQW